MADTRSYEVGGGGDTEVASFGILNLQMGTDKFRKCVTL